MKLLPTVGVSLGLWVSACAHTAGSGTAPASVGALPVERPAMDGTCTVTTDDVVQTYTYEQDRLTVSTSTELDFRTLYTYEGAHLTRVVRTIGGELAFRMEFHYGEGGRLDALVTLRLSDTDRTLLVESQRRVYEYDTEGRLRRMTDTGPDGQPEGVCTVEHDTDGRLVSHTCEVPGLEAEGLESTRYHYDASGRLSELRMTYSVIRMRYDAAGRRERAEVVSDTGDVLGAESTVRDAEGHEVERRSTSADGREVIARVTFDGNFGAGAICGGFPPAPPGIPEVAEMFWFGISP